jgi:hypothetical protein
MPIPALRRRRADTFEVRLKRARNEGDARGASEVRVFSNWPLERTTGGRKPLTGATVIGAICFGKAQLLLDLRTDR